MSKIWMYPVKRDRIERKFRSLKEEFEKIEASASRKGADTRAVGEILDAIKVVHAAMEEHIMVKEHRKKLSKIDKVVARFE